MKYLMDFNLTDDLMEPYRPMVDLVVHQNIGSNLKLTNAERKNIAHVLHNACMIDEKSQSFICH